MKPYLLDTATAFRPAPREYLGNMCGVRVPRLPPVSGGAHDASLFLSWFYARYNATDQSRIRAAMQRYPDWLLSWPDDRAVGLSGADFGAQCRSLIALGFRPAVMLLSKDYDPSDFDGCMRNIAPVLPHIIGLVPRMCIGFELNSFLSPEVLHRLIDALTPQFVAYGCKCYVHFTPGVASWQEDGHPTCDFWNAHIGQLTGLFHQRIPGTTPAEYQTEMSGCLDDVLVRFAGEDGFSPDSGFGHPWDCIALEITASEQFDGMSDADGDRWGDIAISTPARVGPLGPVPVMGSGNGLPR